MSAIICKVQAIYPHPDAHSLELLKVVYPIAPGTSQTVGLVTGPHYRAGQLGVYIPPGSIIPGWLAVESWLVGKGSIDKPYTVQAKMMRGIDSPGIFCGQWYMKDPKDARSVERYAEQRAAGMEPNLNRLDYGEEWIKWRYWRDEWKLGQDVSGDLGVS